MHPQFIGANQALWNQKTKWHLASDFYDVPGFLAGNTSLMPTELAEVGEVAGKRLLHLQCHFGQDTLSWARLGAKVTGVDFSTEAIQAARQLQAQLGLAARFEEANVLELDLSPQRYDIIYTSYGTVCWLDDLDKWAGVIARHLSEDGFFYLADFHPTYMMFNFETMRIEYNYFKQTEPYYERVKGTYADTNAPIEADEYFWNHSLSETIGALLGQGLQLEFLHEFPFSHYKCFPNLVEKGAHRYEVQGYEGMMPLMFSLKASWAKKH